MSMTSHFGDRTFAGAAPTASNNGGPAMAAVARVSRLSVRHADERAFRLLWAPAFLVFLLVALIARPLPRVMRERLLGSCAGGSVIAEARAMATMTVSFAFMG
jgi:hypothetical protein